MLLSIAIPAAGLWLGGRPTGALTFELDGLDPIEASYPRIADEALDPEVLDQIRPDAYVQRAYADDEGTPLWLYLGLYAGLRSEGAHSPEICYPAQGWEVIEARSTWVSVGEGERFRARLVRVAQGHRYEWVLWWFQPADRWTLGDAVEQLQRVYDGVRGRAQYAFVRLSAPALEGDLPPDSLLRLAATLAPHVRTVVEQAN